MATSKTAKSKAARSAVAQGQHCAVINPYALADLVSGQRIPWTDIPDPERVLEQVLATPYEELDRKSVV